MIRTINETALEIKNYILTWGKPYKDWYSGITGDPDSRVFQEHGVRKDNGHGWIIRECSNSDNARKIEEYLVNVLGGQRVT